MKKRLLKSKSNELPIQEALDETMALFLRKKYGFSNLENDCINELKNWKKKKFKMSATPCKYEEMKDFIKFTLNSQSKDHLYYMNNLTFWAVERDIVTKLTIFNHFHTKFGWIFMKNYFKKENPGGTIKPTQDFNAIKYIIQYIEKLIDTQTDAPYCIIKNIFPYFTNETDMSWKISEEKMDRLRVLLLITYIATRHIPPTVKEEKLVVKME